ncbi:hypothetical protein [Paenibacillus eucommiae]|uniref:Energy-converting hydrogenase Eha subunit G n=1 Tax=Paenibacillus eucommiae TaxID=1355755 RepID=A0ABS4J5W7_9BACL|nr:hypothetical protein [Paenibacillus eucommiae]MBP1994690.1 energy-converting hydrogenase Eha subunit G [Paenibacillus eucommiae]
MSGFIICFLIGLGGSLVYLLRRKKSVKEISLFVTISLLGFIVWLSIFLGYKTSPDRWIGWLFESIGL